MFDSMRKAHVKPKASARHISGAAVQHTPDGCNKAQFVLTLQAHSVKPGRLLNIEVLCILSTKTISMLRYTEFSFSVKSSVNPEVPKTLNPWAPGPHALEPTASYILDHIYP